MRICVGLTRADAQQKTQHRLVLNKKQNRQQMLSHDSSCAGTRVVGCVQKGGGVGESIVHAASLC